MRHHVKDSKNIGKMRGLITVVILLALQLDHALGLKFLIQQTVLNSIGGCGLNGVCGPDDNASTNRTVGPVGSGCYGRVCPSELDCSCLFSTCVKGVCVCEEGFVNNEDGECIQVQDPTTCAVDDDCFDDNKECFRNFCVCKINYKFTIDLACIAVLGTGCRDDADCAFGEYMVCDRELCMCDFGYREDPDGSPTCVVDETCISNEMCDLETRGSICGSDGYCVCPPDFQKFRDVCARSSVGLGETCEWSWQCGGDHKVCRDDAICACEEGFAENNGECEEAAECSIGGPCTSDDCCQNLVANSVCDCETSTCSCQKGYVLQTCGENGAAECVSMNLLGDPCENDAECQAKTTSSVCFEGYCACGLDTVEAYQCEPITILSNDLSSSRFYKVLLPSGSEIITSPNYDTGTYPPNKVFAYSVVAPVGKILKVTINNLVLGEGSTLSLFMSPWKKIAEVNGLTNAVYQGFQFSTYQNRFIALLESDDVRAKGFSMTVEVAEKEEGYCMEDVAVTGTDQPITAPVQPTNAPFCHLYLQPERMSDIVYLTLNSIDVVGGPPAPDNPFNLFDSVSAFTSRLVEVTSLDPPDRTLTAYPAGGLTLLLNKFDSLSDDNSNVNFEGHVLAVDYTTARTCGFDITATATSATEDFDSTSTHHLCIWQITPTTPDAVLEVTITKFTTTHGEDSLAIYSGNIADNTVKPKLGAFDSSITTSKTFDTTCMESAMFILLRVANTDNLTELSFSVVERP